MSKSPIKLAREREEFLQCLQYNPADKRDLVDRLDVSRATVHRVVDDLIEAGLVRESAAGLRTTTAGALLLDTVRTTNGIAGTIQSAHDTLRHFPDSAPLDPIFFRDADFTPVEPPGPEANIGAAIDQLAEVESLYGLSIGDNSRRWINTIYEQSVVEEACDVNIVMSEEVTRRMANQYEKQLVGSIEGDCTNLRYSGELPYGLFVMEKPGQTTAYLLVHGNRTEYLGHFKTSSLVGVEWAKSVFDRHFENGTPVSQFPLLQ